MYIDKVEGNKVRIIMKIYFSKIGTKIATVFVISFVPQTK